MKEEKMKILQMLADGIITAKQADELLEALNSDDAVEGEYVNNDEDRRRQKEAKKIINKEALKAELNKMKEDLLRAKDEINDELKNVNLKDIKENLKNGMDEIDEAMKQVDKVILEFGDKIKETFSSKKGGE